MTYSGFKKYIQKRTIHNRERCTIVILTSVLKRHVNIFYLHLQLSQWIFSISDSNFVFGYFPHLKIIKFLFHWKTNEYAPGELSTDTSKARCVLTLRSQTFLQVCKWAHIKWGKRDVKDHRPLIWKGCSVNRR